MRVLGFRYPKFAAMQPWLQAFFFVFAGLPALYFSVCVGKLAIPLVDLTNRYGFSLQALALWGQVALWAVPAVILGAITKRCGAALYDRYCP